MESYKEEMKLFKKVTPDRGRNAEENEVLMKAEEVANRAYTENYHTYLVLAELGNLIDNRYELQKNLEARVRDLETLYYKIATALSMSKEELILEYNLLDMKDWPFSINEGSKEEYIEVLIRIYSSIYKSQPLSSCEDLY